MFRTASRKQQWAEVLDAWNPGPSLNPPDRYDVWEHNRKKILDYLNLKFPHAASMELFTGLVNEGKILQTYPLRNELIWVELPKPEPPLAPTPMSVEQKAQALVDNIKEQLAKDQRERLAASMSGIINHADSPNRETPEQEEQRRRETAERLERARHALR